MPKLGVHGRSLFTIHIRLCPMEIMGFLPFHRTSVGSVSVLESNLNPEPDHLRVICQSIALLVYVEGFSPGPMF